MVANSKTIRTTVFKLSIAAFAFTSLGAVVVAAPFVFVPRASVMPVAVTSLQPLASGSAIQLAKAGYGDAEDCVRVTRMTGPDGKEYPTRGVVCTER